MGQKIIRLFLKSFNIMCVPCFCVPYLIWNGYKWLKLKQKSPTVKWGFYRENYGITSQCGSDETWTRDLLLDRTEVNCCKLLMSRDIKTTYFICVPIANFWLIWSVYDKREIFINNSREWRFLEIVFFLLRELKL